MPRHAIGIPDRRRQGGTGLTGRQRRALSGALAGYLAEAQRQRAGKILRTPNLGPLSTESKPTVFRTNESADHLTPRGSGQKDETNSSHLSLEHESERL